MKWPLFKSKPEELVAAVLKTSIDKQLEKHCLIGEMTDENDPPRTVSDVAQAMATNEGSPGGAQGNRKEEGRTNGKKKKDKGSGKGKGKDDGGKAKGKDD